MQNYIKWLSYEIYIYIYIYVYAKWYYFCRKVWVWMQEIIFVERCECECKKIGKWVVRFFLSSTRIPPKVPIFYPLFAAPKVFPLSHFLGCTRQKVQPSFPTLFLVLCFFLLSFLHGSPPSLTKTKYPSLKKKLKG